MTSPHDPNIEYRIGDEKDEDIQVLIGLKLSTSAMYKIGAVADFNFKFSPIPLYHLHVEKMTKPQQPYNTTNFREMKITDHGKTVYTGFNPTLECKVSVFYLIKTFVRAGISNYNPYNAYYRSSVDGLKLRDHLSLKPDKANMIFTLGIAKMI
ncbi:hypothetical protein [Porphyromonas pogonae]|uniref:hypothetical protein n=1 Tax=Porphyromonas pogonae TaxID=867595 RepID=UPI002E77DE6B|nr:hypothetical protein [Porphyromonas pogonae]